MWLDNFLTNTDSKIICYTWRTMQKLGLPTSKEYLKTFIEKTILPAQKKQSNTFFFVKGTGRNSILRYCDAFKPYIEKELSLSFGDIAFLTVDTTDRHTLLEIWIRTLRSQNIFDEKINVENPFRMLESLVSDQKKRVLLCVWVDPEGVDVSFLESLRRVNPLMIDFQFGFPFEVSTTEIKNYLGELTSFALQNIWYMPLYNDIDMHAVIQNQIELGFSQVEESKVQDIVAHSGGYPRLARFFLRNLGKITVDAWDDPEVKHFFDEIWDGLSEEAHSELFSIVSGKSQVLNGYLLNTGLVKKEDALSFFSPLFEKYVSSLFNSKPPTISKEGSVITIAGDPLESLLSDQEAEVFKLLFEKKESIVTRDAVAHVMWGEDWEEKYSDWAIDQIVSRIRKKIGDRSHKELIKTVRGKGFVLN